MMWKTVQQCSLCWAVENPGRKAVRFAEEVRETEPCVTCGENTNSGIYVRKGVR